MSDRIRVFLVDDHAVLRAGLRMLLNAEKDMVVVGEAPAPSLAFQSVADLQPDVVLLDISMPEGSGVEALREFNRRSPSSRVLMLTMHNDEGYLRMALAAGAAGYVLKQAANEELLSAIRVVSQGGTYLHDSHRSVLFEESRQKKSPPEALESYNRLSPREKEILRLIALGYTNRQAAEELFISEKTIETYKSRLMSKLNLHSRVELIRFAMQLGVIQP